MSGSSLQKWRALAAAALAAGIAVAGAAGCDGGGGGGGDDDDDGSSGDGGGGGGGQGGGGGGAPITPTDKLDLLLAIDNSRTMADKQEVLAQAIPDLVQGLVNPRCLDASGAPTPTQPAGPTEPCPAGSTRAFNPVLDIHIGIVSSSIGGHGSDACQVTALPGSASNNDQGRLLARSTPELSNDLQGSTYQGKLFLAWDPTQRLGGGPGVPDPNDGEADIDTDSPADLNTTALVPTLREMVRGVGQVGCGYESQLESWYRFLADPEPYQSISVVNNQATPQGVDEALLQQRVDFLRPGSVLAIAMLTDENDCSIRESGQYFYAAQATNPNGSPFRMPRPRSVCATNPDDPCCKSCGQDPGSCPTDTSCYVNGDPGQGVAPLTAAQDPLNMRCFDQKRRFGIDMLYPVDRYIQALTSTTIQNRKGEVVPNPIFSDLNPSDADTEVRTPSRVFLAGIVGVPWQLVARKNAAGQPDLVSGLNAAGLPVGGFKSAAELAQPDGQLASGWDRILGDPASYVPPADPHMVESILPRGGLPPPGSAAGADPIHGHEYTTLGEDLQYACVFALPAGQERDCTDPSNFCECQVGNDNPLCCSAGDPDPRCAGAPDTILVRAKAYPGVRHLQVLQGIESQAVVASLCPAQMDAPASPDFGYRPAVSSLIEALAPHF